MDNNQNRFQNSQTPNMNLPYNGNPASFHANIPNAQQYAQQVQQNMMGQQTVGMQQMQGMAGQQNVGMQQMQGMMGQAVRQKTKKKGGGKKAAIILTCVFLALAGGGAGTYFALFTPEKRYERAMDKADTAYKNGDYKAALDSYEKALSIKEDDFDALYGKLSAELADGDTAKAKESYKEFTARVVSMDDKEIKNNADTIKSAYLYCLELFEGDNDKICSELETAMRYVGKEDELLNEWADIRLSEANMLVSESAEQAAAAYDAVLTLDEDNAEALSGRSDCVRRAIDYYISIGGYDQADALIQQYRDKITDINFADLEMQVSDLRTVAEAGASLMEKVYSAMSSQDYFWMCEIDCSREARDFLDLMQGNRYLYAPDGFTEGYTGTAVGLYVNDSDLWAEYYFYYGNYENGIRAGSGVAFMTMDQDDYTYSLYDGKWRDDAPNGMGVSGTYHELNGGEIIDCYEIGNYTNGYADGNFTTTIDSDEGYTVYGEWSASMGVVSDVRDEFPDVDFSMIAEGRTVYAVLFNSDGEVWIRSVGDGVKKQAANWFE